MDGEREDSHSWWRRGPPAYQHINHSHTKKAGTKADRMMLKPQQHSTCSSLSETWSAPQKGKMRVFLYKTWIEVVLFFSTTSHFIWSKKKPPTYFPAGIRILFPPMSRLHIFPYPHTLLLCIPLSTSPSFFLDHRQWCLVNITLIHSSFKCRHYGYQMHLWLFRPIDWHNQYVILGKFGDTTLELPDALKALSSNLYGDGASSLS